MSETEAAVLIEKLNAALTGGADGMQFSQKEEETIKRLIAQEEYIGRAANFMRFVDNLSGMGRVVAWVVSFVLAGIYLYEKLVSK